MTTLVQCEIESSVASITMDDGKVNALSLRMLGELNAALDRAAAEQAIVVLGGRPGVFSAGFDLPVLRAGGWEAITMFRAGFELAERLLSYPRPVVIACSGHAMAMGAFLLLSGDYRIGTRGAFKLAANEVAIGVTMPRAAVEILAQRLNPACFTRATLLAETFSPDNAIEAGFFDRVVDAAELRPTAAQVVAMVSALDAPAFAATKLRARQRMLASIRSGIETDHVELCRLFAPRG